MNKLFSFSVFFAVFLGESLFGNPSFHGGVSGPLNVPVPITDRISFDQHIGTTIPLNLPFSDEMGNGVTLQNYMGHGAVILGLVYYGCPNLCMLTLSGLSRSLSELKESAGKDFSVVFVSIDPSETPAVALKKKLDFLRGYRRTTANTGTHFLTGHQKDISLLADTIGFKYFYDSEHHQYAHPSGIVVLTPEGKIARYLFGVDFPNDSLRLSLLEASKSRLGLVIDQFLLFCYHYDPTRGTYTLLITRILTIAGVVTVLVMSVGIFLLLRWERVHP